MQYQDFVYELLHKHGLSTVSYGSKLFQQLRGENKAQIEIKLDSKFRRRGKAWHSVRRKIQAGERTIRVVRHRAGLC